MAIKHKPFLQRNRWYMFFAILGGSLFLLLLLNVLNNGPIVKMDMWISMHIADLQTKMWTKIIVFLTNLNGVVASSIFCVLIGVFLWYRKWYGHLRFFLSAFLGVVLLFNGIKFTVQRARPDMRLFDLTTYSFPSGHTTMATVLTLSLYFIFAKKVPAGLPRILLLIVCIVWPVVIAFTRIYLNVHWFSDVLGGFSLGLFWVMLTAMVYLPYTSTKW